MKVIYVTGFMGAGKTTVGKVLGGVMGVPVYDIDEWIVKEKGKSIPAIFADEGESAFRMYETEALSQLPTENVIVTTGGGIVEKEENRQRMRAQGYVIYLFCQLEEVKRRIGNNGERPLLQKGEAFFNSLYESRKEYYEDADYIIDTTNQSVAEIVQNMKEWIYQKRAY